MAEQKGCQAQDDRHCPRQGADRNLAKMESASKLPREGQNNMRDDSFVDGLSSKQIASLPSAEAA